MKTLNYLCTTLFLAAALSLAVNIARANDNELRHAVQTMKEAPRGPFSRLRWFCADGAVLPPEPYACSERGGGVQHGEYSKATRQLRDAGYPIATLLADINSSDFHNSRDGARHLKINLLERFLIDFDAGWIYRKAQFYRGAIQHEDEQRSGQALLEALASDEQWLHDRYLVVREAVRLLPHDHSLVSLSEVRGRAASIADADPGFRGLRGKIHGRPDAADADRVRNYARTQGKQDLDYEYETLAAAIDETYSGRSLNHVLETIASTTGVPEIRSGIAPLLQLSRDASPGARLAAATQGMKLIREQLSAEPGGAARVSLLDSSVELERIAFIASRELETSGSDEMARRALLGRLEHNANGLYGAGLITAPEHREVVASVRLMNKDPLTLERYRKELQQLGMASVWASRQLRFHFGDAIDHLTAIEPLVDQFVPDRLRASQLLAYEATHGMLALDAQSASDIRHEIFGEPVVTGLRSMNPGLARGELFMADHDTPLADFVAHGIYIVPETLPRLPPVAGILTRSEGNALSHVQLLARNLGIPNIVVSEEMLDKLKRHVGERVVIAGSVGGVVRIARETFEWDNVFRAGAEAERVALRIDTDKLALDKRRILSLTDLRSSHSGREVGPKAAKLGELMHRFPGQVAAGIALPFGIYRQLLEQPIDGPDSDSMFEWLAKRYQSLEALRDQDVAAYDAELDKTLAFVRSWFQTVRLPPGFEQRLRQAMRREFGPDGSYGVFVRSDTNVEDLPNFSGAGLNLTVPNVVGFDATLEAIRRVWASPFSRRAFAWRQGLMDRPEHVYASVLLQRAVPADKSGVLVTRDIATGSDGFASIVVNFGVGGGVDGQQAETLVVGLHDGTVRRVTSATASQRSVLLPGGGTQKVRVPNSESVLSDAEIQTLRRLTLTIPERMAEFATAGPTPPPAADVEFGFLDGKLWLFQVRPFVESGDANRNRYLNALDAGLRRTASRLIDLDSTSGESSL